MSGTRFAFVQPLIRRPTGPGFAAGTPLARNVTVRRLDSDPVRSGDSFMLEAASNPAKGVCYRGAAWQGGRHLGFAVAAEGGLLLLSESPALAEAAVAVAGVTDSYFGMTAGTPIDTPDGPRAVETLAPGAAIRLAGSAVAPIRGVAQIAVCPLFADPLRALPVRILAGALGGGVPRADLSLSPDLALLLDGCLIQAGALVDGRGIRREAWWPDAYWRLRLPSPGLVGVLGVAAEAIASGGDDADRSELPAGVDYPRATSHRQVPYAIRARLAE